MGGDADRFANIAQNELDRRAGHLFAKDAAYRWILASFAHRMVKRSQLERHHTDGLRLELVDRQVDIHRATCRQRNSRPGKYSFRSTSSRNWLPANMNSPLITRRRCSMCHSNIHLTTRIVVDLKLSEMQGAIDDLQLSLNKVPKPKTRNLESHGQRW